MPGGVTNHAQASRYPGRPATIRPGVPAVGRAAAIVVPMRVRLGAASAMAAASLICVAVMAALIKTLPFAFKVSVVGAPLADQVTASFIVILPT